MSSRRRPSPPWIHHPKWYDERLNKDDYLTYLSEDGYLFRVAIASLRTHSELVKTMEEVAYDDGNPIFLPNMTASDLELVFGWLSHKWQYNDESLGKQDLISLLRAGRFFMMPSLM
ncbi:hypothetical protein EV361DRAFT_966025 [Lentinula raphanica]|nr:hypothetical protein EV361DRAFT_966025 [Lentinula raphanica]